MEGGFGSWDNVTGVEEGLDAETGGDTVSSHRPMQSTPVPPPHAVEIKRTMMPPALIKPPARALNKARPQRPPPPTVQAQTNPFGCKKPAAGIPQQQVDGVHTHHRQI
eukprot:GHVR01013320.1.p2 GENE.GHVR01013320.1~~GHVR01013320.1.p2  ORF type:complete len:108 (+),score=39.25 GHVR01013320.1:126-449(+)